VSALRFFPAVWVGDESGDDVTSITSIRARRAWIELDCADMAEDAEDDDEDDEADGTYTEDDDDAVVEVFDADRDATSTCDRSGDDATS
jgi:hypothetical protein